MADNTVADLPKKNAAPAEAPKSLSATINNVIAKAVTSPTDGKIDFAQGVKPVSGDAHQKSAGAADAMQSLKAGYMKSEMEPKKDEIKAAYEADEKKDEKEMKEAEMKKDDEKKDMKEGEMPQAALDALKKKQDAEDKKEEKEDKKDEVKEMAHGDKKKDEAVHDDEKKKDEAVHDKDDKKKEMSEAEDKEDEKEKKETYDKSAKEKVKEMNMADDVNALVGDDSNLSEEFKQKAATIFEAAVRAKLVEEIESLEGEYEKKLAEKTDEVKDEIVEKVDAYLNYVVSEWMKDNELAIEKGLRNEITEEFIGGLKTLYESHYIEVPKEKYNVIDEQAAEIEELKSKLNESIEQNVELNSKIGEFARDEILADVASDLAETEKEKFKGLAETIEYTDAADFRKKVETVKESYFPKKKVVSESTDEADKPDYSNVSDSMAAYAAAISKTNKNPYGKK